MEETEGGKVMNLGEITAVCFRLYWLTAPNHSANTACQYNVGAVVVECSSVKVEIPLKIVEVLHSNIM